MSEKALFYNALPDGTYETGYDRNYDADDISDWLNAFISTGIVKSSTGLKVVPDNLLTIRVNAGKAIINGKPYKNDSYKSFTLATAPTGATNRIDAVVLRYDKTIANRNTYLMLVTGANDGTIPKLTRNNSVYDLMLAYITVVPYATSIGASDITPLYGDTDTQITLIDGNISYGYCPFTVATKGYDDYYDGLVERYQTTTTVGAVDTNKVTTELASNLYKPATDIASVYINGALIDQDEYTLSIESGFVVINFNYNVLAGQDVTIVSVRAYDGEGLPNVLEDYLNLKQQVEALQGTSDINYTCNGVNDNVLLSQIAQTYLNGGTDRGNKIIHVNGNFGMTSPNNGAGSQANPYTIFNLGLTTTSNRRITFDFSNCSEVSPTIENDKYYTMFGGVNVSIIGGSFSMSGFGYLTMFNSLTGDIEANNTRFIIIGASGSYIAGAGTFTNCYSDVTNLGGTSCAYYVPSNGLLRLINGEHYAYGISGQINGAVYISTGIGVAVLIGANFPVVSRGGFIQTNYLYQATSGGFATVFGVISTLPNLAVSGITQITSKVPMNKPNLG